ncbi:MAG: hypothetical protein RTU30_04415 [Candidatus Thorarchaeota archaeon]
MKTDELLKQLISDVSNYVSLPWLNGYTDYGSFSESGPPDGDITVQQVGPWLLLSAELSYRGRTMDRTTDRAGGDPYSALVKCDWIGPSDSAPSEVSHPDELVEWALYKSTYAQEHTDAGSWGVHQGSWVESVDEDGTVTYREATGAFQDVSPRSMTEEKTTKLELP